MLYVYPALAAVIIILGVVYLIRHHRGLAIAGTVVALTAALAWIYFLIRRDEMIQQQMAMQQLGGNLGQMMKDIQQDTRATDSGLIHWGLCRRCGYLHRVHMQTEIAGILKV